MARRKDTGPLSHVNKLGEMPTRINSTDPDNMHAVPEQPKLTFTSGIEVLNEGTKLVLEGAHAKDPAKVRLGFLLICRAVLWFFGGNDYLTALDNPQNADKVPGATADYLNNQSTIQEHAPAVAMAVDDDHIKSTYEHLRALHDLLSGMAPIQECFGRLGVHLTRDLADNLTIINDLARRAIESNVTLTAQMINFNDWATASAQKSVESKKTNEKQQQKGFNDAIDAVKQAMDHAKSKPTPPGAPAPEVDLESLKAGRNRNRGAGRPGTK